MRTEFTPQDLTHRDFYRLLTAVVVPRPIAWVSSTSDDGIDNLAPHSFFTVASVNPPIVQFTSVGEKDTLRNIRALGEFVVNFATASLMAEVNATGTNFSPDVSEFDMARLVREPSHSVRPPRVQGSPVALECRLHQAIVMGDCTLVFGEVIHAAVSSAVLDGDHPRLGCLQPLARLGRDEWAVVGEVRELKRIRRAESPGPFQPSSAVCRQGD